MSLKTLILYVGEIGCYFGPIVSLFISWKLARMRNINLMNKMFLIFFLLESIFGTFETAFLFDLNDHRYFFFDVDNRSSKVLYSGAEHYLALIYADLDKQDYYHAIVIKSKSKKRNHKSKEKTGFVISKFSHFQK